MTEIHWLAATILISSLFWAVYILNALAVRGLGSALRNPSPNDLPLAPWAQRAKAAHNNATENLVLFAPLVLGVVALGESSALSVTCSAIYFFARTTHFVVYVAGIPVLRTLAFVAGWLVTVVLALIILGVL